MASKTCGAEFQGTKGEWTLDETWMIVKGPKGEEVAAVHSGCEDALGSRVDRNIAHENARAIAAIPSMLSALYAVRKFYGYGKIHLSQDEQEVFEAVDSAIDKVLHG